MTPSIKRAIFRWIHIVSGIPILGYIYTPFEELHGFAHLVRFGFVPVLVLSGLWMWKSHVVERLIFKKTA